MNNQELRQALGRRRPKEEHFGMRLDDTPKGPGFLGSLRTPTGDLSTELSIGVDLDGRQQLIPSLVPTLDNQQIAQLLRGGPIDRGIVQRAVEHAKMRQEQGLPVFAEQQQSQQQPENLQEQILRARMMQGAEQERI